MIKLTTFVITIKRGRDLSVTFYHAKQDENYSLFFYFP
jgi:hypothetical protein